MTAGIRVFAPAKINLTLHVVGRRADGYHLLHSLVAFAGVGDDVTVRHADGLSLTLQGPGSAALANEPNNIVLQAARQLAEAAGITPAAAITLDKQLPVASGIGGGSTDAAATLLGLARLWGITLPDHEMAAVALRLGADVPVCLFGRAAIMEGVGEIITPAPPLPSAWLVLVNPGQALSTPSVFRARSADRVFGPSHPLTTAPADVFALAKALQERRNDLTEAACTLMPEIVSVLLGIERSRGCLLARMSGSGATCFGLFAEEKEARTAAEKLKADQPQWWTAAAALLDQ